MHGCSAILKSPSIKYPTITEPTRVCAIEKDGQNIVTESLIDNVSKFCKRELRLQFRINIFRYFGSLPKIYSFRWKVT